MMKQTLEEELPSEKKELERFDFKEDQDEDYRVVVNVGGVRHETFISTLERIPGTRLALLASLGTADESYDEKTGEFFFDRNYKAFEIILHFHRTEELHMDQGLCGNVVKGEFAFWGIDEQEIEACCWADYSKYTEHRQTLRELDDNFAFAETEAWGVEQTKWQRYASQIWTFLEDPTSSRGAKIYAVVSMTFVALSIMIFVLESHKMFQMDSITNTPMYTAEPDDPPAPTGDTSITCCCDGGVRNSSIVTTPVTHPALMALDYMCVTFFTLEIIIRFAFAPNKRKFCKTTLNIIDVVCLLPHFISFILKATNMAKAAQMVKIIMMLRVIRILRIFKLMKHYSAFKILVYTIKVSTKELLLMVVFLMSGVLMFASIIHYAEKENFPNIPIAIWWALVTMTTVGYGDKYPIGYIGYGVGCVSVISGVLVIAFTVPIVVNNFSLYYSHAQTRLNLNNRRRQVQREKSSEFGSMRASTSSSNRTPRTSRSMEMNVKPAIDHKQLNVRDLENDLGRPVKHSSYGSSRHRGRTPTDDTHVEDLESLDSGISNEKKTKKFEEETKQMLLDLAGADKQFEFEKARQNQMIKDRREERRKQKEILRQEEEERAKAPNNHSLPTKRTRRTQKK